MLATDERVNGLEYSGVVTDTPSLSVLNICVIATKTKRHRLNAVMGMGRVINLDLDRAHVVSTYIARQQ